MAHKHFTLSAVVCPVNIHWLQIFIRQLRQGGWTRNVGVIPEIIRQCLGKYWNSQLMIGMALKRIDKPKY